MSTHTHTHTHKRNSDPPKKDKKRLTSNEMKFFRRTAQYTFLDHKMNEKISEELKLHQLARN